MIADLVEPTDGHRVANVLAWEVSCCDGPIELRQSVNHAGSEGRMLVHCPRCNSDWITITVWRQVGNLTNAHREAAKRQQKKNAA